MKRFLSFFAFASIALAFSSCTLTKDDTGDDGDGKEPEQPTLTGDLVISVDRNIISADGKDGAVITVTVGDVAIDSDVKFYDAGTNKELDMPGFVFKTSEPGTYSIWASYKAKVSKPVTISAISAALPELPADKEPGSHDFHRRVLITQFTGTGCPFCPFMINLLKRFAEAPANEDRYVLAACHTYNPSDPAYLSETLPQALGVSSYPCLALDLKSSTKFNNYTAYTQFVNAFNAEYEAEEAAAGIAVSTVLDGSQIVVKAGVKAASDGEYRLALWVLEDGIIANQVNNGAEGEFNIHDNCVRIVSGKNGNKDFTGTSYELKAGGTVEQMTMFTLGDKMVGENCHVVAFVSTSKGGAFSVNNVVDCPLNSSVGYQYR